MSRCPIHGRHPKQDLRGITREGVSDIDADIALEYAVGAVASAHNALLARNTNLAEIYQSQGVAWMEIQDRLVAQEARNKQQQKQRVNKYCDDLAGKVNRLQDELDEANSTIASLKEARDLREEQQAADRAENEGMPAAVIHRQ